MKSLSFILPSETRSRRWEFLDRIRGKHGGLNRDRRENPVLGFDHPWEKNAVMCPHVVWDEEA